MMDQAFHVPHDVGFGRRNHLGHIRHDGPFRQLVQALLNDSSALLHFLDANPVPVISVSAFADRHVPFHPVVDAVRLELAHVVGHSRPAERRPGQPEVDRIFRGNDRHVFGPGHPDPVPLQQRVIFLHVFGKRLQKPAQAFNQFRGQVAVYSPDSIIIQRQPRAAELFKKIQQDFPFAKRPEEHRHGPDIQGLRAQPEEVADDALHFGHDRADVLGPLRYRHADQFFNGAHVGIVVRHGAHIIQAIRMRNDLHVMEAFGEFFDAAMQIPQIGNGFGHSLAVQFQHHPQDAVRAGMLRPHVEQQFGCALGGFRLVPGQKHVPLILRNFAFGPFTLRLIQAGNKIKGTSPPLAFSGKILPQGMAFRVIVGQQNPPQIRMAFKRDPHQVVDFTFQEIRALPDGRHGPDDGILLRHPGLQTNPGVMRQRQKVVDDFKPFQVVGIIGRADVGKMIESHPGIVVQEARHVHEILRPHLGREVSPLRVLAHGQHGLGKTLVQGFKNSMHTIGWSDWLNLRCNFQII